jgi:hypothetical protein
MKTAERTLHLLQTLLTRQNRDQAPVHPSIVLGRHQDGTESLQRQDTTCPTRSGPGNHYTGTIVLAPSTATSRQGTTGIGTSQIVSSPTLWIETITPNTYHPGQTYQVTITGRGFSESVQIDFLYPAPETPEGTLNPDLVVLEILVVSSEILLLELSVAPTARPITNAPIAYGRP